MCEFKVAGENILGEIPEGSYPLVAIGHLHLSSVPADICNVTHRIHLLIYYHLRFIHQYLNVDRDVALWALVLSERLTSETVIFGSRMYPSSNYLFYTY